MLAQQQLQDQYVVLACLTGLGFKFIMDVTPGAHMEPEPIGDPMEQVLVAPHGKECPRDPIKI